MNDVSSAVRAAALKQAEQALEEQELRVLDRDWTYEDLRLDLVVTPGSDILGAVEVKVVAEGTLGACVATLTEARFWQVTDALQEWQRQHEGAYRDLWVILVTVDPVGGLQVVTGNATGVA